MPQFPARGLVRVFTCRLAGLLALSIATAGVVPSVAEAFGPLLGRGALTISRSVYAPAPVQAGVTQLPPGCVSGCVTATSDGTYPFVFNNNLVDGSFGVTTPIFLDQWTANGSRVSTTEVPPSQMVTSFSSKSELALDQSTNGQDITFMGYVAPVGAIDVSNSNTPGVIDPTNPVPGQYFRAVADEDANGQFSFTETNAYSGNNGRAALLNSAANLLYTAGNAGNGGNPQPNGIILGAGAQIMTPMGAPESAQSPGTPTPFGSFSITELGQKPDKVGKDDNFRGLTVFNNVVYYTKGSGGNGIDTVYFVDTTGTACPNGVGLPVPGAALPTSPLAYDLSQLQTNGLPNNMCVLKGFNTTLAKTSTDAFPFGVWFASANTLYVADEGNGDRTFSGGQYANAAAQTKAGIQKWVFDARTQSWQLAYTLQNGLNLGQPYSVSGYPTGNNPATGLPWSPATDGLRNLTGEVIGNQAVIWAATSTVSGSGDQGADPNRIVTITDNLSATNPGAESFLPFTQAKSGEVLRGVSFSPGATPGHG